MSVAQHLTFVCLILPPLWFIVIFSRTYLPSHCFPSSHFLLSSSGFLLPFWRITVVAHGAYWGAGGRVILLDFKCFYPISSVTMTKTLNIRPLMDWFYHLWSWPCMCFLCLYYTQLCQANIETLLTGTISHWKCFIDLYSTGSWCWM